MKHLEKQGEECPELFDMLMEELDMEHMTEWPEDFEVENLSEIDLADLDAKPTLEKKESV